MSPAGGAPLVRVLEQARDLGFLGPGPVEDHIAHAAGFAVAAGGLPAVVVDLGSGGGVPALALAARWPEAGFVLIEAGVKRAAFLRQAVLDLGYVDRVEVRDERAEAAGRAPILRGAADLVTARSFGPPATTAECAVPFLAVGGRLVVSEPPDGGDHAGRWPTAGLAELGLEDAGVTVSDVDGHVGHFRVLVQRVACSERYPRRNGVPAKRPLW